MVKETNTEAPVAWLRDAHNGEGDECLVPCAKGDPGGFPVFTERDNLKQVLAQASADFEDMADNLEAQIGLNEQLSQEVERLREALGAVLPFAEVGEYLTESCTYSYGDGYTQPYEYGIDWQWQQSSPDLTHGPFALQADVDAWIKDQTESAKEDEVECVLESVKARAALHTGG